MIETNILKKLNPQPVNEAVTYQPNQLLAQVIGNHVTGMGFYYPAYISEPQSDEAGISVNLNVDLNGDDVDVMVSPNVMYCYINASNIDYFVKIADDVAYNNIANFGEVLKANHFVQVNPKAWRDDKNLYLLKINLNTGIIGRYDPATGKFRNQEVNWNSSTPEEVVELLLTKEYLEDYFRHELCSLESYVGFATPEAIMDSSELSSPFSDDQ